MDNLKDLYIDMLQDLWSANAQCAKVVKDLHEVADNKKLQEGLHNSLQEVDAHNANLETLIKNHDAAPRGEHCRGMEGLVKEARAHAIDADYGDPAVRDAMIIAQQQRLIHYGIAGYGTCIAVAKRLGLKDEADKLQSDIDDIYAGDKKMTEIAESEVNEEAAQ